MFNAMEEGKFRGLYVIGENPAHSEADQGRCEHNLKSLDFLVVQDVLMTGTAELADVILPAAAGWCESEGTVTNSERRVQRVRRAMNPPAGAMDDVEILCELARRLGHDWGHPTAEEIWNELRKLSPMHGGMSYARLEEMGGIQWPCYDEGHPGELYLHSRLWNEPLIGPRAPFSVVQHDPPVDALDADFPLRLTTGRHLESVQHRGADEPVPLASSQGRSAGTLARRRCALWLDGRRAGSRQFAARLAGSSGAV